MQWEYKLAILSRITVIGPGGPQQQEISLQLPKSAFFLPELWPVAVAVVVVVVVGDKKHLLLQLSS